MSISYDQKTWYNGEEGGTPITASELNRMEQGIADAVEAINEGGGGQGGGAHTNLDNIANTTTNSTKSFTTKTGMSTTLQSNYQCIDGTFVKLTAGKTYVSTDGVNWDEYNNNLSSFTGAEFVVGALVSSGNIDYVAIMNRSNNVKIWYSFDLTNWTIAHDLPNTSQTYSDDGYALDDSVYDFVDSTPFQIGNKLYCYISLTYNDNESDTRCISTTTSDTSYWSVEAITPDISNFNGTFLSRMRKVGNNLLTIANVSGSDDRDIYQSSDGTTFTKVATLTLQSGESDHIPKKYMVHNGVYYYQTLTSIYYSDDLENWDYKYRGFTSSFINLLGFCDDVMVLSTEGNTKQLVYLSPDSNGIYHVEKTAAEIEEMDGCGIITLPNVSFGEWGSSDLDTKDTVTGDVIGVDYVYATGNTATTNIVKTFLATPFVNEVSLAANILGLGSGSGSGGGSGTSDYPDLNNKPKINGVELLGNKLVGLLSTDIQINAEKIGYSGTVSGANTAKAAIEALKSSIDNISVDADDVAYDNTTSGLSATDVQNAIDEVNSAKGNASISVLPNTYNGVFRITNESTSSNHDVYAKSYVKDMLDPCLQTPINNLQPNIVAVSTLVTLKTDSSADYGQIVQLRCQFGTYNGAFDNSGNATFNVGYVGVYNIYIASTYRRSIYINSTGGCFHFPLSSTMTNVDIRTRDAKIIGQQLGIFDTSDNMIAKFKLTKDDYSIALPNPSSTYIVKMYVDVDQSISQATTNVSDQFVPNTADVVLCTHPASGNDFDPIVRISTTDLTPGSSDLADGTIYLVYE